MKNRPEIIKTIEIPAKTKTIVLEKSRPFNEKELKRIKANWKNGDCPSQCIGKCNIPPDSHMFSSCSACGWDDY
jgi:hypothetical protein